MPKPVKETNATEPHALDGFTTCSVVVALPAFWLMWAAARLWFGYPHPWLALSAQLWVAYCVPWLAFWVLRRRGAGQSVAWSAIAWTAVLASLVGAVLSLPLAIDFLPARLLAPEWWLRRGALPWAFGLLLHLPGPADSSP